MYCTRYYLGHIWNSSIVLAVELIQDVVYPKNYDVLLLECLRNPIYENVNIYEMWTGSSQTNSPKMFPCESQVNI